MAQLDQSQIQEAQAIAAQAMAGDGETSMATVAAVDVGDVKDFFCNNWPTIKKVLQFLADTVGGVVKIAARALIAAGDFLHGRICNN